MASFIIAYDAARSRATNNQITDLDNNLTDKHGIEVTLRRRLGSFRPPHRRARHGDLSSVSTSFLHLFYPGPVKNSVNAVTRIHPRTEFAYGQAIVSLSDECGTNDGGVVFDGTSDVHINGGGVYSNSCIDASGNVTVGVDESAGSITSETLTTNGHPVLKPGHLTKPARKCPGRTSAFPIAETAPPIDHKRTGTINPGNFSKIKLTNGTLKMEAGLYCLTGDMELQGGTVLGDGVTIYMKKDGRQGYKPDDKRQCEVPPECSYQ